MDVRAIFLLVPFLDMAVTEEYTDWTTLFWLKSGESGNSYEHWLVSGSYDSATNMTVGELLTAASVGYRNIFLDTWTSENSPDKIRVSYRNAKAVPLYQTYFTTTGSTLSDWSDTGLQFRLNKTLQSFNSSFATVDETMSPVQYQAVTLSGGITQFLVAAGEAPVALPLPAATAITGNCYASNIAVSLNLLHESETITNLTHEKCSSFCMERQYPYGAINNATSCSCLDAAPSGPEMTTCNSPCEGNTSQTCGGYDPSYTPITIMETGVNLAEVDGPLETADTLSVVGTLQTSYTSKFYLFGYNVTTSSGNLPVTIDVNIIYRTEPCGTESMANRTVSHSVPLTVASPVYGLRFEPFGAQCVIVEMFDSTTNSLLTFPVDVTTVTISADKFLSATYLSVEASWIFDFAVITYREKRSIATGVNTTGMCECECWVHELLYGESPFDNLTYDEIEKQLENITSAIIRELSVNRSSLSSTIRTKTSADDSRPSAAVVGYSLGVAILSVTLCGLLLADVPKLLKNVYILLDNVKSRFCPSSDTSTTEVVAVKTR